MATCGKSQSQSSMNMNIKALLVFFTSMIKRYANLKLLLFIITNVPCLLYTLSNANIPCRG